MQSEGKDTKQTHIQENKVKKDETRVNTKATDQLKIHSTSQEQREKPKAQEQKASVKLQEKHQKSQQSKVDLQNKSARQSKEQAFQANQKIEKVTKAKNLDQIDPIAIPQQRTEDKKQQSNLQEKQQPTQTDHAQNSANQNFSLSINQHLIKFTLSNSIFIVKAQKQLQRQYLLGNYPLQKFTEQMKAIFDSPQNLWNILNSSWENIIFQNLTLGFNIIVGGKNKLISIPLERKTYTDPEYIEKLQLIARRYKEKCRNMQSQIKQKLEMQQKEKGKQSNDGKSNNSDKKTKLIEEAIKSSRQPSQKSFDWLQNTDNLSDQDPLILFDQLLLKMKNIREQFQLLISQIKNKISAKSGVKFLRIKLLTLQKKKRDWVILLEEDKKKFFAYQCRKDIESQVDQLVEFMKLEYETVKDRIESMD